MDLPIPMYMMALVVLRNGLPRMMGGSHSSPISMTMKSVGT